MPAVVVAVVPATEVVDPDVDADAPVVAVVPSALADDVVVVAESDELLHAASASAPAPPPRNISARRRDIVWMSNAKPRSKSSSW